MMNKEEIKLEDLNLTYLDKTQGRVKMIKWGKDFLNWPLETQNEYLRALASSFNEATERMQAERDEIQAKLTRAEANLKLADERVLIYKTINDNAITDLNNQINNCQKEKAVLNAELRELKK